MPLLEIKAEIPRETVDAVEDLLLATGVTGWTVMEDVLTGRAWVRGFFASEEEARVHWQALDPRLPAHEEPVTRAVPEEDWRESYKAHFKPWHFGRLHWVPVWERERHAVPPGDEAVWLDPGMAFGTGNHETTRLCCERLVVFAVRARTSTRVIDAGCGSGILAISAAKLGLGPVYAFDNDAEAIAVSRGNAALNGVADALELAVNGLAGGLAGREADLVLANIQADVLVHHADALLGAVAPRGQLVLSGILAMERDVVRAAFAGRAPGWAIESQILGEWADLVLNRA